MIAPLVRVARSIAWTFASRHHKAQQAELQASYSDGYVLSPLLANVLLDEVDKELERRGHAFVRYADDLNIYVRSKRAGERVMEAMRRLYARLKLHVNEAKSAVARATERKFLGFSFWIAPGRKIKRRVANETLKRLKEHVRTLTRRSVGKSLAAVCEESERVLDRMEGLLPDRRDAKGPCRRRQVGAPSPQGVAAQALETGNGHLS